MNRASPHLPTPRLIGLRLVLGVLCLYHLGVGVATVVMPAALVETVGGFYGISAEADAQFVYMLKALGMYACFTGALLGLACLRPFRHRAVVYTVIGLLCMRALTRLACYDVLYEAFGVEWSRNLFNVALLLVQAGVLFWAIGLAQRAAEAAAQPLRLVAAHERQPARESRLRQELGGRLAHASARLGERLQSARLPQPRFDACASGVS